LTERLFFLRTVSRTGYPFRPIYLSPSGRYNWFSSDRAGS
jgi:hypothetical protein